MVLAEPLPLESLFDVTVATAQATPALVNEELYPEELEVVIGSVPKRQAEFGTGRVCARRALAQLGFRPQALVPLPDRSPSWPEGAVGTITHCAGYCAVAVARASDARGLGLDVEIDTPLDGDLEPLVCTPAERRFLAERSLEERGRLGKLLFSAKEAFYKCQYATTRAFLEFKDVELSLRIEEGAFAARLVGRRGPEWSLVESARGRFLLRSGFIVTAATL